MWWLQALILGGLYQVDKHPFSTVLLAMVNSSFWFLFFSTSLKSYPIYNGFLKKGVCKCLNLTSVSVSLSLSTVLSPHTLFIFGACFISSAQGTVSWLRHRR